MPGASGLVPGVISTCLCIGVCCAIFGTVATDVGMWDTCCSLTECGSKKNCECVSIPQLPENATCDDCLVEFMIGEEMVSSMPFCTSMFIFQLLLLFWQMRMLVTRSTVIAHVAVRGILILSVIFQALEIHYVATPKSLSCETLIYAMIDSSQTSFFALIIGAPLLIAAVSSLLLIPAPPMDGVIDPECYEQKGEPPVIGGFRIPGLSPPKFSASRSDSAKGDGSETDTQRAESTLTVYSPAHHVLAIAGCAGLVAALEQMSLRELYWQIPQIMDIINNRGRPIPYLSETKRTAIKVMAEAAVNLRLQELVPIVGLVSVAGAIGGLLSYNNIIGVLKVQPILIAVPSGNLPYMSHPYSFSSASEQILSGGEPGAPAGYAFAFDPDMPVSKSSKDRKDKKSKKSKKSKKEASAPAAANAFGDGSSSLRKVKRKKKKDIQ
eukprot:TRINITY_DN7297_c0_g1_i1.p1 TRINITY_DN7297_c0_g1~~TRINITY_DN7297_c0_g1_i1.p1  ORF type:complete len:438 (+),score=57.88 TRINITY_DN7297_c0_g1_i1:51-1364(+)